MVFEGEQSIATPPPENSVVVRVKRFMWPGPLNPLHKFISS